MLPSVLRTGHHSIANHHLRLLLGAFARPYLTVIGVNRLWIRPADRPQKELKNYEA